MVDFAVHAGPLKDAGVKVAGVSVDSIDSTATLKAGLHVGFPMYAEADAAEYAAATGAFIQTGDRTFLHATGFLVNPDGVVMSAVYSTGPAGRLTAGEVLRLVSFLKARAAG